MGDRIARLVLSVFYFTIAMPFGLIVKLTQDPLHVKDASPAWLKREGHDDGLEQARRMF